MSRFGVTLFTAVTTVINTYKVSHVSRSLCIVSHVSLCQRVNLFIRNKACRKHLCAPARGSGCEHPSNSSVSRKFDFIGRDWGHMTRGDNYQWPFQGWNLCHACIYDSNLDT